MMNEKIGFDCIQVLIRGCDNVFDLDEAFRVLNLFYSVFREQLLIMDEIKSRGFVGK